MSESFVFDEVERFTAGAIGEPGSRVFYLQAVAGGTAVSVKCEKLQVGALAEYLTGVVADLPPSVPAGGPMDLVTPVLPEWVLGAISVAYDDTADRITLVMEEAIDESGLDPDAPSPEPASFRVQLTRPQVLEYIDRASELIDAGRPPCPLCGHPKGPDHACPRTNGHGPPR